MIPSASKAGSSPDLAAALSRPSASSPPESAAAIDLKLPQVTALRAPVRPQIQYDPEQLRSNLKAAIEDLNKHMSNAGRHLGFQMDDALNGPIITVRNTHTGEVIRQIPNEAVVKVAHTFESLKGLLYDAAA